MSISLHAQNEIRDQKRDEYSNATIKGIKSLLESATVTCNPYLILVRDFAFSPSVH